MFEAIGGAESKSDASVADAARREMRPFASKTARSPPGAIGCFDIFVQRSQIRNNLVPLVARSAARSLLTRARAREATGSKIATEA